MGGVIMEGVIMGGVIMGGVVMGGVIVEWSQERRGAHKDQSNTNNVSSRQCRLQRQMEYAAVLLHRVRCVGPSCTVGASQIDDSRIHISTALHSPHCNQ